MQVSGASTYSGGTTISGGILQLGGAAATLGANTGALTVVAGAELDLNGFNASVGAFNGAGTVDDVSGNGTPMLTIGNGGASGTFSGTIQNSSGTLGLTKTGSGTETLTGVTSAFTGNVVVSGGTLDVASGNSSNFGDTALGIFFAVPGRSITINAGATLQYAAGNATGGAGTQYLPAVIINGGTLISTSGTGSNYFSSLALNGGTLTGQGGKGAGFPTWGFANATAGTISVSGNTPSLISGTGNYNGTALAVNTTVNITGSGGLTISNPLWDSSSGAAAALTETGSGLLTLAASNAYSGGTTIAGGTLQLGNNAALGAGVSGLAVTAGVLDVHGFNPTVGALTGAGTIDNAAGGASPVLTVGNGGASGTFSGTIQDSVGTVSLVKEGNGLEALKGANTYTGGTQVTGGTLQVGNAAALGSGPLAAGGGVLDLAGVSITVPAFSGATGIVTNSVLATASTLTVSQTGSTAFGGTLQNGPGVLALAFSGGSINLSGSNNYSGGTRVIAGSLQLGSSAGLGAGTGALAIGRGGLLDLNGFGAGIGVLTGTGTIDDVTGAGMPVLTFGNGGASGTFSGTIQNSSGTVGLVKNGGGTQVFSGINTYRGATTVTAGVLMAGASNAFSPNSNVSVTGGTLDATNSPQSIYAALRRRCRRGESGDRQPLGEQRPEH